MRLKLSVSFHSNGFPELLVTYKILELLRKNHFACSYHHELKEAITLPFAGTGIEAGINLYTLISCHSWTTMWVWGNCSLTESQHCQHFPSSVDDNAKLLDAPAQRLKLLSLVNAWLTCLLAVICVNKW